MTVPRVRFAPAPTGYLHLGGARTALFNWLFARNTGGEFVLRIEDTDLERSKPELIQVIYDTLEWLGLDWDGEPVRQSERLDEHQGAVEALVAAGHAYEAEGAIRFRVPEGGTTVFDDVIRGRVEFEHAVLEDFVLRRSDGSPTFYVANAVDDRDMGITHVIRGEDLLNVTPRVLLIREALGDKARPVFAHVPLIVNDKRQKLSKRRDDVAVEDYRARGFLAEAMVNYLATLGWGPPDGVDVRPLSEIVELFSLEGITKSPAFFDIKKLEHFNGEWIRRLSAQEFVDRSQPWLSDAPWADDSFEPATFEAMAPHVQSRVKTMSEVAGYVDFLFLDQPPVDQPSWEKAMVKTPDVGALLDAAIAAYEAIPPAGWVAHSLHERTTELADARGLKLGKAQAPIRVAVTGRTVGPPLFESLEALGRDRTLDRLRAARSRV